MGNLFSNSRLVPQSSIKKNGSQSKPSGGRIHPADRVTIDAFRPIASIGQSHFGSLCLAERRSDARLFTIRFTLKYIALRDDLVDAILNEKRMWQHLDHPLLSKIRYCFQNDYYLYLVQDYIGGNLQSISMDRKWLEIEIVPIATEVVSAILYLHRMGIVHRDVRPKNIHLDFQGHAILTELGLSAEICPGKPLRSVVGCDGYMAPEIFSRDGYDESIDFWSLGVTIYEMLFRERPFKLQIKESKKIGELRFPDWIKSSQDLQSLVSGLINIDPHQRLGSKGEGIKNLLDHPLFQFINWEIVDMKMSKPVYHPKVTNSFFHDNSGTPEIGNGLSYITNLESKKYLFKEFEYFENPLQYIKEVDEIIYPNIILGNDTVSEYSEYTNRESIALPSVHIIKAPRRNSSPTSSIRGMKSSRNSVISQQADSVIAYYRSSNSMIDSIGGASFSSNLHSKSVRDRTKSREGSFASASLHHKLGKDTRSRDSSFNGSKNESHYRSKDSTNAKSLIKEEEEPSDRRISLSVVPQSLAKHYTAHVVSANSKKTQVSSPLASQEIRPRAEPDEEGQQKMMRYSLSPNGSFESSITSPNLTPKKENSTEADQEFPRLSHDKAIESVFSSDPNINEEGKKVSFARKVSQKRRMESSII